MRELSDITLEQDPLTLRRPAAAQAACQPMRGRPGLERELRERMR